MIAIPATLMMLLVLYYIGRAIHQLTGLKLTECLHTAQ
jgi:hypothetical protein